jgi:hypothetical protein
VCLSIPVADRQADSPPPPPPPPPGKVLRYSVVCVIQDLPGTAKTNPCMPLMGYAFQSIRILPCSSYASAATKMNGLPAWSQSSPGHGGAKRTNLIGKLGLKFSYFGSTQALSIRNQFYLPQPRVLFMVRALPNMQNRLFFVVATLVPCCLRPMKKLRSTRNCTYAGAETSTVKQAGAM